MTRNPRIPELPAPESPTVGPEPAQISTIAAFRASQAVLVARLLAEERENVLKIREHMPPKDRRVCPHCRAQYSALWRHTWCWHCRKLYDPA